MPLDDGGPVVIFGRYLYAVTRGVDRGALGSVPGMAGATVDLLEHEGLQAVVSTVDLDAFGEQVLAENLADVVWRHELALHHHEVLLAAARCAPVAPVRLATVCPDDVGVRRHLDLAHEELVAVLDRRQRRLVSGPRPSAV